MTALISKPKMAELWFGCFEYYPCIQKWQYIQWMFMCGVGRKACGSLDEIPSVKMGTCKRKFLIILMTLTVLNLHQQKDPKVQQDFKGQYRKAKGQSVSTAVSTKYQLPTPYGFQDITRTRFYRSRSLRQGQRSNQGHTMMLHTYYPQPMSQSSINVLHLTVAEI